MLPGGVSTNPYEILNYEATLTLEDPRGIKATFRRTQKIRFIQEGVSARQWDAISGAEARSFKENINYISSITISSDGKQLASTTGRMDSGRPTGVGLKLWDVVTGRQVRDES